ncbi:hypothetical protein BTE48_00785 [Oceanospirillum multiglobuliferum]|uniref:Uncharacterized protein n=1 Tax=Oceanospirillum multiglobuliferum TaxID=64969 RepID=A0A1V4T8S2_9GAMM|nr:hypothetical protein BTE48_00785 [Oceanospirillum multiglobuliferum]
MEEKRLIACLNGLIAEKLLILTWRKGNGIVEVVTSASEKNFIRVSLTDGHPVTLITCSTKYGKQIYNLIGHPN